MFLFGHKMTSSRLGLFGIPEGQNSQSCPQNIEGKDSTLPQFVLRPPDRDQKRTPNPGRRQYVAPNQDDAWPPSTGRGEKGGKVQITG